jgi:hypothetical protein
MRTLIQKGKDRKSFSLSATNRACGGGCGTALGVKISLSDVHWTALCKVNMAAVVSGVLALEIVMDMRGTRFWLGNVQGMRLSQS